jgi:hypothetical protein
MATAYLTRNTGGTGTSGKKFTISFWMKCADTSSNITMFSASSNATGSPFMLIQRTSGGRLRFSDYTNSTTTRADKQTTRLLRDTSGYYHVIIAVDTDQSTASERNRIYINGVEETSFNTDTNYSSGATTSMGQNNEMVVGRYEPYNSNYFDGIITHFHYADGQQYAPTVFGESDSVSGIWKPKTAPSVTYGNNGFFLKFENSGAMGTDSSGNSNTFTVNGTLTQNVDTPSNNFATGNPLYFTNSAWTTSLSNGNLTVTGHSGTNSYPILASTLAASSGKFYGEFKVTSSSQNFYCGVATPEAVSGTAINAHYPNYNNEGGSNANAYSIYGADGLKYVKENGGSTSSSSYGSTTSQNDIIGIALDLDNNKLYFHKNGTYFNSGVPTSGSTGTGAISVINHDYLFFFCDGGGSTDASGQANFGGGYFGTTQVASAGTAPSEGGIFEYDCPSGYQALCTKGINSF